MNIIALSLISLTHFDRHDDPGPSPAQLPRQLHPDRRVRGGDQDRPAFHAAPSNRQGH